jgi:glycosyltransferase involved in cell wall biosynthesis
VPLRLGFLAQENLPVPPHVPGASVSRVVYELARRAAASADVAVCSIEHPHVAEGLHDGVEYLRVPAGLDARRHDAYSQLVRVLRRADLPRRELWGMPFYSRRYARQGLLRLRETEPDVLHLQNVSQFVPLARRSVPGARVVLHMHCDWLRQLPAHVVRRRLEQTDLILGVSDYITGRIRDGFPDLADRCATLHNGVDVERFSPANRAAGSELRAELGIGDRPVVLYVGTIAVEKGTETLVRAFRRVRARLPDAVLLIVGRPNRYAQVRTSGPRRELRARRLAERTYAAKVHALAEPLGGSVIFAGGIPHDELGAYYAAADVFTMASTAPEPFALPVLEALASALPIVATRTGGLPEAVLPGTSGVLVEPGDEEALAAALLDVLEDDGERAALGAGARTLAETRFTWDGAAARLLHLYEQGAEAQPVVDEPVAVPT